MRDTTDVDQRVTHPPSTQLKRHFERAVFDSDATAAILDEALIGHLSTIVADFPTIIPTTFVRIANNIYLHGAKKNRAFTQARGKPACFEVAILDGLVYASIAFNHSMNYRSVVVYGVPIEVVELAEKVTAMDALIERFEEGRSSKLRPSNATELDSTTLLRLPLDHSSTKMRKGPPAMTEEVPPRDAFIGTVSARLQFMGNTPSDLSAKSSVAVPTKLTGPVRSLE